MTTLGSRSGSPIEAELDEAVVVVLVAVHFALEGQPVQILVDGIQELADLSKVAQALGLERLFPAG